MGNSAAFSSLKKEFERIEREFRQKPYFLRAQKFQFPSFEKLEGTILDASKVGRIMDNCDFS